MCDQAQEDARVSALISRELGRQRPRVWLSKVGQRSHTGYKRRPSMYGGHPAVVVPNHLDRQFEPAEPIKVWSTNISYIRTHDG